jgi:hypothetical protein
MTTNPFDTIRKLFKSGNVQKITIGKVPESRDGALFLAIDQACAIGSPGNMAMTSLQYAHDELEEMLDKAERAVDHVQELSPKLVELHKN